MPRTGVESPWEAFDLGELVEIVLGGTPSTEVPTFWDGDVPWMSSGDVHQKVIHDVPGRISSLGLNSSNARLVDPPAVAVALAGQGKTRGTVALVKTRLSTNQSVALLRPHDLRLDALYLFHNLESRYDELRNRSMGGGRAGLSGKVLAAVPVALPPIGEQHRIARILESLDDLIRTSDQVIAKLASARQGVLDDLVWPLAKDAFIPLADLCVADICYGIVQSGSYVTNGIPVLAIRDLRGDFETGLHRTSSAIDARYRRSSTSPGDVLLSIKGTIGRVGIVPNHYTGNISREIARLRFSNRVLPEFARLYLSSRDAQRRLDLAVVGTTRAEISIHVLKRFGFPVPELVHQERMVEVMRSIEREIATAESSLSKLLLLRRGLAEDLLTGRVRVPEGSGA